MKKIVENFQIKNLYFVFAIAAGLVLPLASTAFACPSGDDEGDEEFLNKVQILGSCDCDCGDDSDEDEEGFVKKINCGGDDEEEE